MSELKDQMQKYFDDKRAEIKADKEMLGLERALFEEYRRGFEDAVKSISININDSHKTIP